ncbi:hypothetical protein L3X38_016250 [Prunus dulcis]|uniref:Uncharacterized protein n=1 Tax=Prunus dulcis TaxID=3755 RepID=A0AAD4Z8Y9_PRUDU|nr:hypothetical protein L3X38_016250 [Prunus dulcis]
MLRQWRIPRSGLINTLSSRPCGLNVAKVPFRDGTYFDPHNLRMHIRVVTHPGIAPASNSLNFGVPTNPKPVSSQKASHYLDARCAI